MLLKTKDPSIARINDSHTFRSLRSVSRTAQLATVGTGDLSRAKPPPLSETLRRPAIRPRT